MHVIVLAGLEALLSHYGAFLLHFPALFPRPVDDYMDDHLGRISAGIDELVAPASLSAPHIGTIKIILLLL